MRYRNIVTGVEFDSNSEIHSDKLIVVSESPKTPTEEKPKRKATTKRGAKK